MQQPQNTMLLAKAVNLSTLPAQGGKVTYTLSATNSGTYDVSLDSFNDVLPTGVTYVANSTTFNNSNFADPYISGSNLIWSSTFIIPAGTTRTLIFQATLPATPGTYTNSATAMIGNVIIDTTLSISDNVPATAATVVLSAPTISKVFAPTSLAVNSVSTFSLTLTNPNAAQTLNGVAVSDTLPAGLVFAAPSGAATTCSGATLSVSGTTIAITGGTLTAGQSCMVSANVTSAVNATYTNTTGTVSSSNGGTGGLAAATVTFTLKPTISKSFSVATIASNGTATLSFTITNNTAAAITGITFTRPVPRWTGYGQSTDALPFHAVRRHAQFLERGDGSDVEFNRRQHRYHPERRYYCYGWRNLHLQHQRHFCDGRYLCEHCQWRQLQANPARQGQSATPPRCRCWRRPRRPKPSRLRP